MSLTPETAVNEAQIPSQGQEAEFGGTGGTAWQRVWIVLHSGMVVGKVAVENCGAEAPNGCWSTPCHLLAAHSSHQLLVIAAQFSPLDAIKCLVQFAFHALTCYITCAKSLPRHITRKTAMGEPRSTGTKPPPSAGEHIKALNRIAEVCKYNKSSMRC